MIGLLQIWALLTRSQCKVSDTQVTIKACGPLVVQNFLLFHVCRFDEYRVVCSLHHGSQQIGEDVVSHTTGSQKDLCDWLNWDQWSVDMNERCLFQARSIMPDLQAFKSIYIAYCYMAEGRGGSFTSHSILCKIVKWCLIMADLFSYEVETSANANHFCQSTVKIAQSFLLYYRFVNECLSKYFELFNSSSSCLLWTWTDISS